MTEKSGLSRSRDVRIFIRVACLISLLSVLPLFGVPLAFATTSPQLSVSTHQGGIGSSVSLNGGGFGAGDNVAITYDTTTTLTTLVADGSGTFSTTIQVPISVLGPHTIIADDTSTSGIAASNVFIVVQPEIAMHPVGGSVGTTATLIGRGFAAGSTVQATFGGSPVTLSSSGVSSGGAFSTTFQVPTVAQGAYTVSVTDTSSNAASTTFFVVSPAIIRSPSNGLAGSTVNVAGRGFALSSAVTLYFDSIAPANQIGSATTDFRGSFPITSVAIPASASLGGHLIIAQDASTNQAQLSFLVLSTAITLSPDTGIAGTEVTISGGGFTPGSTITLTFDGSPLTTSPSPVIADGSGNIPASTTFTVPLSAVPGGHGIFATDGTNRAIAGFGVTIPRIDLSQRSGQVSRPIRVIGEGFVASCAGCVTITFNGVTVATASTDASGLIISGNIFAVPIVPAGPYTVSATDGGSPVTHTASATFTVFPRMGLSRTSGPAGTTVNVIGGGFAASSAVTITYDGVAIATPTTDAAGRFASSFVIPAQVDGFHALTATDASGNSAYAIFDVTAPSIT